MTSITDPPDTVSRPNLAYIAQCLDEFGEAIGCADCKTMKETRPQLRFKYSKCCGLVWCYDCVKDAPRKYKTSKLRCPGCGVALGTRISDWADENIDKQRYNQELSFRETYASTFNLKREDFDTVEEYNDYLEMVQDVMYDLVHGTATERQRAHARIAQFRESQAKKIAAQQQASQARSSVPPTAIVLASSLFGAAGTVQTGGQIVQMGPAADRNKVPKIVKAPQPPARPTDPAERRLLAERKKQAGAFVDVVPARGQALLKSSLFLC